MKKEKKGGREKMSFRNMRNDVSKVPGWLLCICSVWERKCVATSLLMLPFYFWSKEKEKNDEVGNKYYQDRFVFRTNDEIMR